MTGNDFRSRADHLRALPLEAVLVRTGAERDPDDPAKWHTAQGVLSVTGARFMNWTRGAGGGGAIDLVIHLEDLGFLAAVAWLSHQFAVPPGSGGTEQSAPRPSPGRALELPAPDAQKLALVTRYLVRERSLPPSVLEPLIQAGRIYADRRGNAVFLLLGKEDRPVGAEIRGTTPRHWKGMAPGSRKDEGYFSVPTPRARTIVLCESAIDALSCSLLHPGALYLSTAGARPNPRWLAPLVRAGHDVCCGFDADPTGDQTARALIALHPSVRRLRPPLKDWNEVLTSQP